MAFQGAVQARALIHHRQAGVDTALTCALLPGAVHGSLARDASPSLVEVMAWHRPWRKSECCLSAASDRPRRGGGTPLPVAALVRGHDQRLHVGRLQPQYLPADHVAAQRAGRRESLQRPHRQRPATGVRIRPALTAPPIRAGAHRSRRAARWSLPALRGTGAGPMSGRSRQRSRHRGGPLPSHHPRTTCPPPSVRSRSYGSAERRPGDLMA